MQRVWTSILFIFVGVGLLLGCQSKSDPSDKEKKADPAEKGAPAEAASDESATPEKGTAPASETEPTAAVTAVDAPTDAGTPDVVGALEEIALLQPPTEEEKASALELATKLADQAQRAGELKNIANARLLVVLAATQTDPAVVAMALRGISKTYGRGQTEPTADCTKVVAARLSATDHAVLSPAVEAARALTGGRAFTDDVAGAVAALSGRADDAPARYAALETIKGGRDALKVDALNGAILAALDAPEAFVISGALSNLKFGVPSDLKQRDAFKAKLIPLLGHADPAVRGESCEALANMAPFGDAAIAAELAGHILPLLGDEHPFVKSRAATSLAALKFKPALHKIVALLDDPTPNTYDIKDFTTIWGKTGWDHHDGSAWSRVDDAALFAMSSMTFFDDKKFEYAINYKTKDEDLKKAVGKAKAWYADNKASLPALE